MNLKAIQALTAINQYGSYTAAADQLGCSKAHLSDQIKQLETEYETALVLRTTRKVSLTPSALEFVQHCEQAFDRIQAAENQLLEEQQRLSGKIRIASVGGILGEETVAPRVFEFMKQHPDVAIDLDFSSSNVDLLSGDYDLAIRFGDIKDSSLIARPFIRHQSLVVASPDYLKKNGTPKNIRELDQHALLLGTRSVWDFEKRGKRTVYHPNPFLKCGNGRVLIDAALNGIGITMLPSFYVADQLKDGSLVSILTEWTEPERSTHILYPPGQYRLARVRALVEYLLEDQT